jgi:enamine deaminase RidA (YjgF/YER057c/UK114 family)
VQSANKTIYISGQIGLGTTLEAQTTAASKKTQLLNCNATFRDVVKMNTYIVHFNPETDYQFFRKKQILGSENYPASTLV